MLVITSGKIQAISNFVSVTIFTPAKQGFAVARDQVFLSASRG